MNRLMVLFIAMLLPLGMPLASAGNHQEGQLTLLSDNTAQVTLRGLEYDLTWYFDTDKQIKQDPEQKKQKIQHDNYQIKLHYQQKYPVLLINDKATTILTIPAEQQQQEHTNIVTLQTAHHILTIQSRADIQITGDSITLQGGRIIHELIDETKPNSKHSDQAVSPKQHKYLAAQIDMREKRTAIYDEVEISINQNANQTNIVVDAHLDSGRTIVITNTTMNQHIQYFDLYNNNTTKTEVIIRQADSLEDILDPNNDGGQPEYYYVEDQAGLQLMVSIPHWSVHQITLTEIFQELPPKVWLGITLGITLSVVAAIVIFYPRRIDDY